MALDTPDLITLVHFDPTSYSGRLAVLAQPFYDAAVHIVTVFPEGASRQGVLLQLYGSLQTAIRAEV